MELFVLKVVIRLWGMDLVLLEVFVLGQDTLESFAPLDIIALVEVIKCQLSVQEVLLTCIQVS
jgi:hypothetical protein